MPGASLGWDTPGSAPNPAVLGSKIPKSWLRLCSGALEQRAPCSSRPALAVPALDPSLWPLLRPGQLGSRSQPCSGGCSTSLGMGPARTLGVTSLLAGNWEAPGGSGRAGTCPLLRVHPCPSRAAPGPGFDAFLLSSIHNSELPKSQSSALDSLWAVNQAQDGSGGGSRGAGGGGHLPAPDSRGGKAGEEQRAPTARQITPWQLPGAPRLGKNRFPGMEERIKPPGQSSQPGSTAVTSPGTG